MKTTTRSPARLIGRMAGTTSCWETISRTGDPSQSAVDLNTNFASSLAGQIYTISLTDVYFTRSSPSVTAPWFSNSMTVTVIPEPSSTFPGGLGLLALLPRHH